MYNWKEERHVTVQPSIEYKDKLAYVSWYMTETLGKM